MQTARNRLKSVIISGYFGFDNCGDEAILSAMIQEFTRYMPGEKIIVLSHNPGKTRQLYHVNAINRFNPVQIFFRTMQSSVFISGGGGLLQDVSGKGYSVVYYLSLLVMARLLASFWRNARVRSSPRETSICPKRLRL